MWAGVWRSRALSRCATFLAPPRVHRSGSSLNRVGQGFLWKPRYVGVVLEVQVWDAGAKLLIRLGISGGQFPS